MGYEDSAVGLGVTEQNYRAETDNRNYGQNESALGIATNRETHDLLLPDTPRSSVYFSSTGERISIDLESDQKLFGFLQQIKKDVTELADGRESRLQLATRAVEQIVFRTAVDETGTFHGRERHVTLGQALNEPVECVDRALAMEAAVKMFGVSDAKMLTGVDTLPNGEKVNHTDIIFVLEGQQYVAVTMGEQAGKVMAREEYVGDYLTRREATGLGKRELKESWGYSYFEAVSAHPKSGAQAARLTQTLTPEGEIGSPTVALMDLNRKLQIMLNFDKYNATVVADDFHKLSQTPLWRETEEQLGRLVAQRYDGRSLKDEVDQRLERRAAYEIGFRDPSMRANRLWRAMEETTVLEEIASSMPEDTPKFDRQVVEFSRLKSAFTIRRSVIS